MVADVPSIYHHLLGFCLFPGVWKANSSQVLFVFGAGAVLRIFVCCFCVFGLGEKFEATWKLCVGFAFKAVFESFWSVTSESN